MKSPELALKDSPVRILSEDEAPPESLHDCYVRGIRWVTSRYSFVVDLDYIVRWLAPGEASGSYRFLVSNGSLVFANADDIRVALDWTGVGLEAQLSILRIDAERCTPNGAKQCRYLLEFSNLDGGISVWATGYEVLLWTEPNAVDLQHLGEES